MVDRYFITGTDTDCGKTYTCVQLLRHVKYSFAIKPVASGCQTINHALVNEDTLAIQNACGLKPIQITPWRFSMPVSPHIAADYDQVQLSIQDIVRYCLNFQVPSMKTLFIEGAGGLLVPLNREDTWLDFLKLSKLPVLIVVGIKLGCINHALLTEQVLLHSGIHCAGWIANFIDEKMLAREENICTLKKHLKAPLLGIIPYGGIFQAN